MTYYRLARGATLEELALEVNALIEEGYMPQAGVAGVGNWITRHYVQAVVWSPVNNRAMKEQV